MKLTPRARKTLEAAARVPVYVGMPQMLTAENLQSTPAVCGNLFRRGLLEGRRQSEQARGERRTYWMIYRITDAGREVLAQNKD